MKVFECGDSDGGNESVIVAKNIVVAMELFEKAFGCEPEYAKLISDKTVIVENLIEPIVKF